MPPTQDDVRTAFDAARSRLRNEFLRTLDASAYLHDHADALDEAVVALARLHLPETGLSVVAVGGYGRRELYAYSDIDLLILLKDDHGIDPDRIEAFTTSLWRLGLTVGAAVRTEEAFLEEARKDVSVATTYLEPRLLFGEGALLEKAMADFAAELDPRTFFRDKMLELDRRYQRFDYTPFALEPNVKESPGGLRDLHVFLWCAKAAGWAEQLEDMADSGLITMSELSALMACREKIRRFRLGLHLISRRHEDRLLFDVQEPLAEMLGYEGTGARRASEVMMTDYYRHAKALTQVSSIEMQTIRERLFPKAKSPVEPIDDVFGRQGDELALLEPAGIEKNPHALLRAFLLLHTSPGLTRFSTPLMRALWHGAEHLINDAFRADRINQATFLKIMSLKKGVFHALDAINAYGILERFLPEFAPIVGQMQHDLYHMFTVDQHTLRLLRNIEHFHRSEFAHDYPLCSQIASGLKDPLVLNLAALFHDIAKGRGGQHAELGAVDAAAFARRFSLSKDRADTLVFLVREHLLLSHIAQKEDISDPAVIERFAKRIGTRERLDLLYLLTHADVRATSPKVWTPWKAELLETLYLFTERFFRTESHEALTVGSTLELRKTEARRLLAKRLPEERYLPFWKTLDLVYWMRHTSETIAWHTEVLAPGAECPGDEERIIVSARRAPKIDGFEVLLSMKDQKDVFLRAVAFLGSLHLSVVDARIHTTPEGRVIDTFLVVDRFERYDPDRLPAHIEEEMPRAMAAKGLPPAPIGRLSRRSRHFPITPVVRMRPDESGKSWLLTIITTDRVGLLYAMSEVFTRWRLDLHSAKIATLGERVEDVFRLTGDSLEQDDTLLSFEADLLNVLSPGKNGA